MTGKFRIEIDGTGTFNEGDPSKDAVAVAKDCVKRLNDAGCKVNKAHFSAYEVQDLTSGELIHSTPSSVTGTDKASISEVPASQNKFPAQDLKAK